VAVASSSLPSFWMWAMAATERGDPVPPASSSVPSSWVA
jgi:hypothetical protein